MNRQSLLSMAVGAFAMAGFLGIAHAQGDAWGDIKGRIVWGSDKIPPQANLDLKANPDRAACMVKGPVKDETWVVNPKNKGVKNVFVWLEMPMKGAKLRFTQT